jgi:hypothetical protein
MQGMMKLKIEVLKKGRYLPKRGDAFCFGGGIINASSKKH